MVYAGGLPTGFQAEEKYGGVGGAQVAPPSDPLADFFQQRSQPQTWQNTATTVAPPSQTGYVQPPQSQQSWAGSTQQSSWNDNSSWQNNNSGSWNSNGNSWSGGGGSSAAQGALPAPSPSGTLSMRDACEAAGKGTTSGQTVTDDDIKVEGSDGRPLPNTKVSSFDEVQMFPRPLIDELKRAFPGPSQIQAYTWPLAMQGKDIVGIAATGSGKTISFLLPAFSDFHHKRHDPYRNGAGLLVMSPTRELAQQIEAEANRFGKCLGITSVAMYGGSPKRDQMMQYRRGVHCIVACPGRLNDFIEGGQVDVTRVQKLVLDEADRMLDMGFEPQIRKILEKVPRQRHTMFFTATWPRDVQKLAYNILWQPCKVMIGNRDELKANQDVTQQVRIVGEYDKKTAILDVLREAGLMDRNSYGKALVFASTKKMCEQLSQDLYRANVYCAAIHGDKEQYEREKALDGLKTGRLKVLVATDVAARGLDIKGVGLVVNYDMANNTEDYVHRIGRTGRAGAKGYAVTLLTRQDAGKASGLVRSSIWKQSIPLSFWAFPASV
eukprot:TRINITY_DN817_c0_g2_i1.p1 TRINITY_DN817_c0_g2~~TRINITY_DN817_c0_g2_i1.p1  ORF type:complete len:550 (-),score=108.69 TRINITY_DN817_c0_g2_i1:60-1709(-)